MRPYRSLCRLALASLAATTLPLLAVPAASADANTPAPYVLGPALGLTDQSRMVLANGHLFVSQGRGGGDVVVLDLAGHKVKDITGLPGATGMVASPDGSHLYVALANTNAISVVDTGTLAESSRLTVDSCPTNLALSARRLFYSFGCDADAAGVASIDPSNPSAAPVQALGSQYSPPLLAGTATVLVTGVVGLTPSQVTAYDTSAGDGSVTASGVTTHNENLKDLEITPDGTHVLVASGAPYEIDSFSLPSLSQTMTYPGVAYPQAVAVSPDGKRIAGGFSAYGDTVHLYDAAAGTVLWKRYATPGLVNPAVSGAWAAPDDQMLPGALVFSTDGSQLFALIKDESGPISFFRSTLAPSATGMSLKVPRVVYGKQMTGTATVSGSARGAVTFYSYADGQPKTLGTVTTSATGVARITFRSAYSGTLRAVYKGDASHLPAVASTNYTAASKTAVKLLDYYKASNGVSYYHSYKDMHGRITISPKVSDRSVVVYLEKRRGSSWVKESRLQGQTNSTGDIYVYLRSAASHTPLRVTARFAGDSFNRGSAGISGVFIIG